MDGTQASSLAPPTPLGFQTIEQIQNMPSDLIKAKSKVNVIGFVKDYRPPVQSRGPGKTGNYLHSIIHRLIYRKDYKSTIEIMDLSIQYESSGLQVNIFLPLEKMPVVTGVSDVVLIRNIVVSASHSHSLSTLSHNLQVQMRHGAVSLLSNIASEFHVLEASKIPPSISAASTATWRSTPSSQCKRPTHAETCYVISANSHVNEIALPTNQEFQDKSIQAMNVKDKFGLLKDVKPNCYYNILGEVIRVWEGPSGAITVYLSDYTTNTGFFNYEWRGTGRTANPRDGDEYGYTNSKAKKAKEWPGPYGKMSIQLTLYDANADFVREQVKVGQWILLYNIRIKYGKMAQILEGSLHSEGDRILVEVMEMAEEPGDNDKRFKEGVHRKYDWWKKFNEQNKKNLDEEVGLGDKRKRGNEDPSKSNSKTRRKERRATAELKAARLDANLMKTLNLNENSQYYHSYFGKLNTEISYSKM
jgi:protection-of-telomeres protein 1